MFIKNYIIICHKYNIKIYVLYKCTNIIQYQIHQIYVLEN